MLTECACPVQCNSSSRQLLVASPRSMNTEPISKCFVSSCLFDIGTWEKFVKSWSSPLKLEISELGVRIGCVSIRIQVSSSLFVICTTSCRDNEILCVPYSGGAVSTHRLCLKQLSLCCCCSWLSLQAPALFALAIVRLTCTLYTKSYRTTKDAQEGQEKNRFININSKTGQGIVDDHSFATNCVFLHPWQYCLLCSWSDSSRKTPCFSLPLAFLCSHKEEPN